MTRRDPKDVIGLWLEEGPVVVSAEKRSRMLGEILATPQSRAWRSRFRATSPMAPISLGISAAAIVVVVAAAFGPGRGGFGAAPSPPPNPQVSPTPVQDSAAPSLASPEQGSSARPIATIDVGRPLNGLVVTADAVWAGSPSGLVRIDPDTNEVAQEIEVPNLAGFFAIGFRSIWVADYESSLVRRIDPVSGAVVAQIPTGPDPEGIALTDDAVWVASHAGGSVTRVDPVTNTVVATIEVGPTGEGGPQHVLTDGDSIWVGVANIGAVVRIDPATNEVVGQTDALNAGDPLTIIGDKLWVGSEVVDVRTGERVGSVSIGATPGQAFAIGDRVWVPGTLDGRRQLIGVDAETLVIEEQIQVEGNAWSAAVRFDSVWLEHSDAGVVTRWATADFE